MKNQKGFTLVELMIVLAILALLAAIVIFALNPAQLFARARDSQRFADLKALTTAINYYLVVTTTPVLDGGTNTLCVGGTGSDTLWATSAGTVTAPFVTWSSSTSRDMDGDGWIKINFSATGETPLGSLPMDPKNGGASASPSTLYTFTCDTNQGYEINANLESATYKGQEATDGGDGVAVYEVGSVLTLLTSATSANWYPNN